MAHTYDTTPNEHRALTPTVRTPQCSHTVWGKMLFQHHQSTERTFLYNLHKTSLQGHLSSNYWTVGTIQQHWPLDSPPAQLQLWVPPFRPVATGSISRV